MRASKIVCTAFILSGPPALAQSAIKGMWQGDTTTDALSGKLTTGIQLAPTSDTDNEFQNTALYIRCAGGSTLDLQVNWDKAMTSYPSTDVFTHAFEMGYRIGQNAVQFENWNLSNDNEGMFYPGNTLTFIEQLEQSTVFVAQVAPVGMEPISATYDTMGLKSAVLPVLKACGFNQQ